MEDLTVSLCRNQSNERFLQLPLSSLSFIAIVRNEAFLLVIYISDDIDEEIDAQNVQVFQTHSPWVFDDFLVSDCLLLLSCYIAQIIVQLKGRTLQMQNLSLFEDPLSYRFPKLCHRPENPS